MNRLLTMAEVRVLLGMRSPNPRLVLRRLRLIAEERAGTGAPFQLFKVGQAWHTTLEDLHRLLPELVAHDGADDVRGQLERQGAELRELRATVTKLEGAMRTLPRGP